jgi:hypothetical protein
MTEIDTSPEAVERLARRIDALRGPDFRGRDELWNAASATLRALAAERDARADLTWFWTIVDRDGLTGLPSDERAALSMLVAAAAERDAAVRDYNDAQKYAEHWAGKHDAALAEAERLREEARFLLARIAEWEPEGLSNDNARDWYGHVQPSLERMKTLTEARAALAPPPPTMADVLAGTHYADFKDGARAIKQKEAPRDE